MGQHFLELCEWHHYRDSIRSVFYVGLCQRSIALLSGLEKTSDLVRPDINSNSLLVVHPLLFDSSTSPLEATIQSGPCGSSQKRQHWSLVGDFYASDRARYLSEQHPNSCPGCIPSSTYLLSYKLEYHRCRGQPYGF